jgi:hypothetical protein
MRPLKSSVRLQYVWRNRVAVPVSFGAGTNISLWYIVLAAWGELVSTPEFDSALTRYGPICFIHHWFGRLFCSVSKLDSEQVRRNLKGNRFFLISIHHYLYSLRLSLAYFYLIPSPLSLFHISLLKQWIKSQIVRALAQEVSRRLPTAAAQIDRRTQASAGSAQSCSHRYMWRTSKLQSHIPTRINILGKEMLRL